MATKKQNKPTEDNGEKVYSVSEFIRMLKLAGKSPHTTKAYGIVLQLFADVIGVALEDVHKNCSPENMMKFAEYLQNKTNDEGKHLSSGTRINRLALLHRYMTVGAKVHFDEMEKQVLQRRDKEERDDKPITLDILIKMMDLADVHGMSIISFLVSTGIRAGEMSKLQLSNIGRLDASGNFVPDVQNGTVVEIPNRISKMGHGGFSFLTSEAREYLTIWLRERDQYIAMASHACSKIMVGGQKKGKMTDSDKDKVKRQTRAAVDTRLFACSYLTINKTFSKLYIKVDGEKGQYGNRCTPQSCRAYFRVKASKTMGVDVAEQCMRHSGYLSANYRDAGTPKVDLQKAFVEGESILYITRHDHRITENKLDELTKVNIEMQKQLTELRKQATERVQQANKSVLDTLTPAQVEAVLKLAESLASK